MDKNAALIHLQQFADTLRSMGETAPYMFGFTARDEARQSSDLDLFIDYDPSKPFSLLDLISMKQFLENELCVPIDITTRNSLHLMLRADIERSAVRISDHISLQITGKTPLKLAHSHAHFYAHSK